MVGTKSAINQSGGSSTLVHVNRMNWTAGCHGNPWMAIHGMPNGLGDLGDPGLHLAGAW